MHDVVRLVLDAEAESKRVLDEAEVEAERLATEARRKAQEIVRAARHQTAEDAETIIQTAEESARREKQERLTRAATEIESTVRLDGAAVQRLVDAVVRSVIGEN
jgi:vacuolar-type H+-ATPase subunit H